MDDLVIGVVIVLGAAGFAAYYMFGSASYGTKRTPLDTLAEMEPRPHHHHGHRSGFCGRGASGHW